MRKRSLLYIGNKLANRDSGTPTTLDTLSKQLRLEGFIVYTSSDKKNKLMRLFHMLWSVMRYSLKVPVVLIDTYSTQNFYYAIAVGNLCRLLRLDYIPILHGGNLPHRLEKNKRLSDRFLLGAKVNVAPSQYLIEAFKEKGIHNLTYIPNTIDIDQYPFVQRMKFRARLLWVRSFAEIYNPLLAITIAKKLKRAGHHVELCMVGPDKDGSLERCKKLVSQEDLSVTFTGKLDKKDWIQLSKDYDIFINTTNFDNMPISVIEAMALGLPVISTDVGGMSFLIKNEQQGVLVPPNDARAFVGEIEKIINHPQNAIRNSQAARAKVEAYDWEIVKHSWLPLLND